MSSALTITLNIHLALDGDQIRITGADATGPSGRVLSVLTSESDGDDEQGQDEDVLLSARVRRLLEERAPRGKVALYRAYLERCVQELGAQPVPPETGNRGYINVNPPTNVRGARLSALNLSSGRLALHSMLPEMADRWPDAEVVTVNDEPSYVRIYLRESEHLEQALDMTRTVLQQR
jgi:hypothetical protein